MKISTRGRYALRVMLDLAEHNNGEYIPLMDIARRQEISEKYLESIVSVLSKQKWENFYKLINEYFDGITLEDLLEQNADMGDYVI